MPGARSVPRISVSPRGSPRSRICTARIYIRPPTNGTSDDKRVLSECSGYLGRPICASPCIPVEGSRNPRLLALGAAARRAAPTTLRSPQQPDRRARANPRGISPRRTKRATRARRSRTEIRDFDNPPERAKTIPRFGSFYLPPLCPRSPAIRRGERLFILVLYGRSVLSGHLSLSHPTYFFFILFFFIFLFIFPIPLFSDFFISCFLFFGSVDFFFFCIYFRVRSLGKRSRSLSSTAWLMLMPPILEDLLRRSSYFFLFFFPLFISILYLFSCGFCLAVRACATYSAPSSRSCFLYLCGDVSSGSSRLPEHPEKKKKLFERNKIYLEQMKVVIRIRVWYRVL